MEHYVNVLVARIGEGRRALMKYKRNKETDVSLDWMMEKFEKVERDASKLKSKTSS